MSNYPERRIESSLRRHPLAGVYLGDGAASADARLLRPIGSVLPDSVTNLAPIDTGLLPSAGAVTNGSGGAALERTDYRGHLHISIDMKASKGNLRESAVATGNLGVTLSATLNRARSGIASETVDGKLVVKYVYSNGHTRHITVPIDFDTPWLPFHEGKFHVKEHLPLSLGGIHIDASLSGFVNRDLANISERLTGSFHGSYRGVKIAGEVHSSGSLHRVSQTPALAV